MWLNGPTHLRAHNITRKHKKNQKALEAQASHEGSKSHGDEAKASEEDDKMLAAVVGMDEEFMERPGKRCHNVVQEEEAPMDAERPFKRLATMDPKE